MSLKTRLILIVGLAALVLGSAIFALAQVVAQSDAGRESSAGSRSDATVAALAREFGELGGPGATLTTLEPRLAEQLRSLVATALVPQVDTDAGYCNQDGVIVISVASMGLRGEPRHRGLPPDQRQAITQLCAHVPSHTTVHSRLVHPHDISVIAVHALPGGAAFTLVRVPIHPEDAGWPLKLAVTVLATILLVGVTIDAIFALRGGAAALEQGLVRLQADLHAVVPVPRAEELARIAAGLGNMAARLATAREHERVLERSLSHQQRLAGLGRVVAGVAHEIRNPLTGIKLKLDTMALRTLDERSQGDVAVCLHEVARLDAVVAALLLVARKTPTPKEPVALGPLLEERCSLLALAAARRICWAQKGDAVALASRDALVRVLDNLLRNAVEASPEAGTVELLIERQEDAVRVTISDAGDGVVPERLSELFEPFFTTKAEGTGLGLWLSRSLIEVYGGQLEYRRDSGKTHFFFTLPAA